MTEVHLRNWKDFLRSRDSLIESIEDLDEDSTDKDFIELMDWLIYLRNSLKKLDEDGEWHEPHA